MLESNTFRNMTLVMGVVIFAVVIIGFFSFPVVKFDENNYEQETFNKIMSSENKTELSAFDITLFYIKAKSRGDVRHY